MSGSGKSSLAFDTLYAEGQRRYVETFSPYARQFLDRMDKPQVDRIEGILPAIAIDQVNPVRNSRSTVGTMTELNDHLKLLYARAGHLHCRRCARPVTRDDPASIRHQLDGLCALRDPRLVITFPVSVPVNFTEDEVRGFLEQQGYTRIHRQDEPAPAPEAAGKPASAGGARRARSAAACCTSCRTASVWATRNPRAWTRPWKRRCARATAGSPFMPCSTTARKPGVSAPACTARSATSTTARRCPAPSPSILRWAPASTAGASAG